MDCREVKYYLNDYADGLLPDEMRNQIAEHLIICKECKEKLDRLRTILKESDSLPPKIERKKDLFEGILTRISGGKNSGRQKTSGFRLQPDESTREYKSRYNFKFRKGNRSSSKILVIAGSVAVVLISAIIIILYYTKSDTAYWQVEKISGSPLIGTEKLDGFGTIKAGDWLITDDNSKAKVHVGTVGEMEVDPGTRLRLLEIKDTQYKIQLDRGTIKASIWAPPELFNVQTPSASVIDLGCSCTLEVNEIGSSYLQVTAGWVALESGNKKVIVPSGAVCQARLGKGPGTPYFKDASKKFIDALERFDFKNESDSTLDIVLNEAHKKDAISLLNLLPDANPKQRDLIFNRLQELVPIPGGVAYEGIMRGSKAMIEVWWESLGYGSKSLFNYL